MIRFALSYPARYAGTSGIGYACTVLAVLQVLVLAAAMAVIATGGSARFFQRKQAASLG
ncbi:hypothetical protein [Fodinicola acaciae]|uniref:hypothetical protein n=1 Tax=Fodinicola acaciae TaxID=2681555 RepID=UPI0013D2CB30|nr:hypothetical protein [Fodinicola acaciae]